MGIALQECCSLIWARLGLQESQMVNKYSRSTQVALMNMAWDDIRALLAERVPEFRRKITALSLDGDSRQVIPDGEIIAIEESDTHTPYPRYSPGERPMLLEADWAYDGGHISVTNGSLPNARIHSAEALPDLHYGTTAQAPDGDDDLYLDTSADTRVGPLSLETDAYNGMRVVTYGGTGAGQSRRIIDTTGGASPVITLSSAWTTTPDDTTTYAIMPPWPDHLDRYLTFAAMVRLGDGALASKGAPDFKLAHEKVEAWIERLRGAGRDIAAFFSRPDTPENLGG